VKRSPYTVDRTRLSFSAERVVVVFSCVLYQGTCELCKLHHTETAFIIANRTAYAPGTRLSNSYCWCHSEAHVYCW